jgi:hypothetical protein
MERGQTVAHGGRKNADSALMIALVAGKTVAEAAVTAGVAERTVYRRLADADFCRRMAELRREMLRTVLDRMVNGMTAAVDRLLALLHAENESVCLGAARSIFELANKLREYVDLEVRITALEQQEEENP